MKLKSPIIIDIAYNNATTRYNPITSKDETFSPDWSLSIAPMPDGIICKATESTYIEDDTFRSNWEQLGEKVIPRGAYHFYRANKSAADQARFFVQTIKAAGGLKSNDILVMDWEEEYKLSAVVMVDFLWNVEQLTGIHPLVYSRARLLNEMSIAKLSDAQKRYLKETKLWIAGTFYDPSTVDNYDVPPPMYIPDQNRYGEVVLWQYALDVNPVGLMGGIPGVLDFNWIEPSFFEKWKSGINTPTERPVVIGATNMTKGIAKVNGANLKPRVTGTGINKVLPEKGYVYGVKGATDITGFFHYYDQYGVKVDLGVEYKVSLANLTTVEEAEPTTPPEPPATIVQRLLEVDTDNGKVRIDGGAWQ